MDIENMNALPVEEDINSATVCSKEEELSVCNCENDEIVTVYEADDGEYAEDTDEKNSFVCKIAQKCQQVKDCCQITAARLIEDWHETDGHPYVRKTRITQVEIFQSPDDEAPVDVFRTEHVKTFSSRVASIAAVAATAVVCTIDRITEELLK